MVKTQSGRRSGNMIDLIGFDADDTLWQNEKFFHLTQQSFEELLRDHADTDGLSDRLLAAEKRNLSLYGFGIKGFILSMVETAIEMSDETLPPSVIRRIMDIGRDMLEHPVELLPHARRAVELLSARYRTVLITKGDLFDQERKIARSGLADYFDHIEIVADKTVQTYTRVFAQHGSGPVSGTMIGNSLKSDVVPMLDAGGWGIFVPHELTWSIEHTGVPTHRERFRQINHLGMLPELITELTEI